MKISTRNSKNYQTMQKTGIMSRERAKALQGIEQKFIIEGKTFELEHEYNGRYTYKMRYAGQAHLTKTENGRWIWRYEKEGHLGLTVKLGSAQILRVDYATKEEAFKRMWEFIKLGV